MDRETGTRIDETAHIHQSIADILTTPLGTRVMRREYGSLLPELVDQPLNGTTVLRAYSATIIALLMWEPRVSIRSVQREIDPGYPTRLILIIDAIIRATGEQLDVRVPIAARGLA